MAVGTPVVCLSAASEAKSSGGQIGSSTQSRLDGTISVTAAVASAGSHAQLVSTINGAFGPATAGAGGDGFRRPLMQFDRAKAVAERTIHDAADLLGIAVILQQRCVDLDAVAPPSTQQG